MISIFISATTLGYNKNFPIRCMIIISNANLFKGENTVLLFWFEIHTTKKDSKEKNYWNVRVLDLRASTTYLFIVFVLWCKKKMRIKAKFVWAGRKYIFIIFHQLFSFISWQFNSNLYSTQNDKEKGITLKKIVDNVNSFFSV